MFVYLYIRLDADKWCAWAQMASEPKDYTIFIWMILTSNTEASENKVQFLNFTYTVKGFQCHSNNSLQLLELKEKNNNKTIHVI